MNGSTTRLQSLVTTMAAAALAAAVASAQSGSSDARRGTDPAERFVQRVGTGLQVGNAPFRVVGASNYYLMYKSPFMVDAVLEDAAASGFNVIRMWGSLEIGHEDGSDSVHGKGDGLVYFQYWDGSAPAFNDGADGLQRLDYVVYRAGQLGIRLAIPLVNNWNDFGGMDQYVRWRGGRYHDDFYTDPVIREWYKNWIAHLLHRKNVYTGVAYKDDPTILMWELANEPRCLSAGAYPRSPMCRTQTITDWAADVSAYVKGLDPNHLLSAGDEGFYCIPGARDWTENCGEGVDTLALAALPDIDVASFHLYPDSWGKTPSWGTEWIRRHLRDRRPLRDRAYLGEFGLADKAIRNPVYKEWTDAVIENGGAGALYWMLAAEQDNEVLYPDFDGFTVYCPSPVCATMSNFGRLLLHGVPPVFPPVADHDSGEAAFGSSVTLPVTANDVTYRNVPLLHDSVDLDPGVDGQQTSLVTAAGSFLLEPGGRVAFMPAAGFSGPAVASYDVQDATRARSNVATIGVLVAPDPAGALTLFSFETDTQGWAPAAWQPDAGTVAQSTGFATDGAYGLQITTTREGWFGVVLAPAPADLEGRARLKVDVRATAAPTSINVALQVGNGWTWCEGAWGWIEPDSTATFEADLTALGCGTPDLDVVQAIYVFLSAGGTFHLDYVRAE